MQLSNKQKKWIVKNYRKYPLKKMAGELGVAEDVVSKFLNIQNKKTPFYFYIVLIGLPILFFLLLEMGLRIFGYGFNNEQWIPATKGKLILNPEIARRYFYATNSLPYSNQDVFDEIKGLNTFRVFILGGSSTAGFPFAPLGAFSRYLQQRLEIVYPESKIEVVNLGMTAVNSYTIRDIFPGALKQQPDLIIIYAGHNEYYGALGVGSMESFGTSRSIINLVLTLNKFKTVELITNISREFMKWFSSTTSTKKDATLMARMVKEQYIPLDSDLYYAGIEQFRENFRDILDMAKETDVPVLLSTLTCNLRDQAPFVSIPFDNYPPADEIYKLGHQELMKSNLQVADSLLNYSKELDALRFRSPNLINDIIQSFGKEYGYFVVNIDSAFKSESPYGIVGNNLMTDHLHPTLAGYQFIGRLFFNAMKERNYLPDSAPIDLTDDEQDSITVLDYKFSRLDSVIGNYRITALKNDWPFIDQAKQIDIGLLLKPSDFVDSLAFKCINGDMDWELVHRKLAYYYLSKRDYKNFKLEMDILISQFPIIVDYYNFTANEFLNIGDYNEAYYYLVTRYKLKPDVFSTKWIGIINLSEGKNESAIKYLEESLKFDRIDTQVLFNLAGAYSRFNKFDKALETINECLRIDPNYAGADNLKSQLEPLAH